LSVVRPTDFLKDWNLIYTLGAEYTKEMVWQAGSEEVDNEKAAGYHFNQKFDTPSAHKNQTLQFRRQRSL